MEFSTSSSTKHILDIPHHIQQYLWDCGLACVGMLYSKIAGKDVDVKDLKDVVGSTSIWTIDLAYVLHYFKMDFMFCTTQLGVRTEYSTSSFYQQNFDNDEIRVNSLFENAKNQNISIQNRSVTNQEISERIRRSHAAIVLVDARKINCLCHPSRSLHPKDRNSFLGHYILLCGYDGTNDQFFYHDPSCRSRGECVMHGSDLWEARSQYGTDQDILFVNLLPEHSTSLSVPDC